MLRLALASYLTLALLAGPAFCCCAASRLADHIAAYLLPSASRDNSPTCPHCCKSPGSADSNEERPSDCPGHCPCQQDRADAVQLHDSGPDSVRLLEAQSQTALNLLIFGHCASNATGCGSDTGSNISRNSLTVHGATIARLLSVLQLLLC